MARERIEEIEAINGNGGSFECCHLAMPMAFNMVCGVCVCALAHNFNRLSHNLFTVWMIRNA